MSVRIMSLIFEANFDAAFPKGETEQENNIRTSTAKLVCLALADHANDEGKGAYPSVERLERKTGLSRRSIQYTLEGLKDAGLIVYEGKSEYGTNNYTICIPKLAELVHNPSPIYGGATSAKVSNGVQVMHPRGATDALKGASLAHESSFKPSINHGESSKSELSPERTSVVEPRRTPESERRAILDAMQKGAQRQAAEGVFFSKLPDGLRHFAHVFLDAWNKDYEPPKSDLGFWIKELREWQRIGVTDDIIRQSVNELNRKGLTIGSPKSITRTALDLIAKSAQGQSDLPPVFYASDEQIAEYKKNFG